MGHVAWEGLYFFIFLTKALQLIMGRDLGLHK